MKKKSYFSKFVLSVSAIFIMFLITTDFLFAGDSSVNEVIVWDWTGSISGTGSSYFTSVVTQPDNSFCLMGHYGGQLIVEGVEVFSSQSDDIFIVKYDESGNYLWSKFLTGDYNKGKGDLAMDSEGNVYVTGSFSDSLWIDSEILVTDQIAGGYLAKFDPEGNMLWIKSLETSRWMNCDNIEIDADNHMYLGGNFKGFLAIGDQEVTGTWSEYENVMFLARMDTSGTCEWISHAVTDAEMMMGFGFIDMDLSHTGDIITCGTFTGQADFGNGVMLNTFLEAPFLVKFNEDGQAQWGQTISTDVGFAEAFDVSAGDSGRIFMTGMYLADMAFGDFSISSNGTHREEIFLARFDTAGTCTSLKSYGSLGDGGDFGICYEPASDTTGYLMGMFGDTLVMGGYALNADLIEVEGVISPNMFIAKLTDDGEPLALKSAGVRGIQHYGEIKVAGEERLFLAGLNEEVSLKKSSTSEPGNVAFVGYKNGGIQNQILPEELLITEQDTICRGDSILWRDDWVKDPGTYKDTVWNIFSGDTVFILELFTEVCRVVITEQDTICQGDSIRWRDDWYRDPGTYTDTVSNGVSRDTVFILELFTEICVAVVDPMNAGCYLIYPNPADHMLYVNSSEQLPFEMKLYGLSGNLVASRSDRSEYEMNVSGLRPGIYILKLIRPEKSAVRKIIIR